MGTSYQTIDSDSYKSAQYFVCSVPPVFEWGAHNGWEAYSSTTPTVPWMLDSVHNEALRLCTGAFRSSPVEPLYAESGFGRDGEGREV